MNNVRLLEQKVFLPLYLEAQSATRKDSNVVTRCEIYHSTWLAVEAIETPSWWAVYAATLEIVK